MKYHKESIGMADDKLQELIETLKRQGIDSGEKEGREIIESARKQAADILKKAHEEAASIVAKAEDESSKEMKRLQSSLEIAASQFVNNLKTVIEYNLLTIPLKKELTGQLSNPDFMKEILTRFIEIYAKDERSEEIWVLLPKDVQEKIKDYAVELMGRHYGKGAKGDNLVMELEAQDIKFGFQISKRKGNVRLDFSDEAFLSLFLRFLSPRFKGLFKNVIESVQEKK
jgi:V/A-type H+-transporting ATPase subunit E